MDALFCEEVDALFCEEMDDDVSIGTENYMF